MKWLLENTVSFRFETEDDMDKYESEVRSYAADNGLNVKTFNKSHKETKTDEYWVAKATLVFNAAADPQAPYNDVEFKQSAGVSF